MEIAEEEGKNIDAPATEPAQDIHYGIRAAWKKPEESEDTGMKPEETEELYDPEDEIETPTEEYKGFLRIRCPWCSAVHSFCAKEPISEYHCKECEGKTKLKGLVKMFVECSKCGEKYKYYTNEEKPKIIHDCFNCGAPVDLELNARKTSYVTARDRIGGGTRHRFYDILTKKFY